MKRVLITGARSWENDTPITRVLRALARKHGRANLLVIHGGAAGVDMTADRVCRALGIHTCRVDALWNANGRAAGPQRNAVMLVLEPSAVIGFHHTIQESRGTRDMLEKATKAGIPNRLFEIPFDVACPSGLAERQRIAAKRGARGKRKKK